MGANAGGAIEIVVDPGGVVLHECRRGRRTQHLEDSPETRMGLRPCTSAEDAASVERCSLLGRSSRFKCDTRRRLNRRTIGRADRRSRPWDSRSDRKVLLCDSDLFKGLACVHRWVESKLERSSQHRTLRQRLVEWVTGLRDPAHLYHVEWAVMSSKTVE